MCSLLLIFGDQVGVSQVVTRLAIVLGGVLIFPLSLAVEMYYKGGKIAADLKASTTFGDGLYNHAAAILACLMKASSSEDIDRATIRPGDGPSVALGTRRGRCDDMSTGSITSSRNTARHPAAASRKRLVISPLCRPIGI